MTWGFWRHDWEIAQLIPSGLLVMGRDGTTCGHQSRISNMLPIGVPRFDCLTYDLCTTETFTGNIKLIVLVGCTSIILHIPGMLLVWSGYRTLYRTLYSSSSSSDTHRNEQNIPVSWHVSWVSKLCVCLCVYVLVSACLSISISILYYFALSYLILSYLQAIFLFIYMSFSYAYVYIYNLYISIWSIFTYIIYIDMSANSKWTFETTGLLRSRPSFQDGSTRRGRPFDRWRLALVVLWRWYEISMTFKQIRV